MKQLFESVNCDIGSNVKYVAYGVSKQGWDQQLEAAGFYSQGPSKPQDAAPGPA